MRLNEYLNEITKGTTPRVKAIYSKRLPEVRNEFEKRKWNINDTQSIDILNNIFKKNNIKFNINTDKSVHSGNFISYGASWDDGSIEIYLKKGFSNYWKRYKKSSELFEDFDDNKFFSELFFTLSHELIHKRQTFKAGGKDVDKETFDLTGSGPSGLDYYSSKKEVEAYAYQAYLEYMTKDGVSPIFDFYLSTFEKNNPTRNRFLKKFYQYLDKQDKK